VALVQRTSESLTVSWEEDPELEKALAGLKRPEAKPRYELQVKAEPGPADASVRVGGCDVWLLVLGEGEGVAKTGRARPAVLLCMLDFRRTHRRPWRGGPWNGGPLLPPLWHGRTS
jgi:hypothetical protein